ncbi:MAG: YihY/virulence factor BrkB family protein [Bacteroidales bacterium]|nr:YihY/virulence factor BrkB family protein [Bacteroidales bacterium]MDY0216713.1 YihY/virulence factor BrkB family protein [Bacteroidales bacterium]
MVKKIIEYFKGLYFVRLLTVILKRITLPGFDDTPIYFVGEFFFKGLFKGSINQRAAALSFTFLLAIFPALLSFFSLIPYIPISNFQPMLLGFLEGVIPQSTWKVIERVIIDIVSRPRGGLLSVSFLFSLFLASNGMMAVSRAFNSSFYQIETRSAVKQRLASLLLVAIIAFLVILSIAAIALGRFFINYLEAKEILSGTFAVYSLVFFKWIIVMMLVFFAISFMYYVAPANKKHFRFISAGSSLATIMSLLLLVGFDFYISSFTRYNALYGSIGTLIVIMMWLYFNSIALLIGFELNVSILKARERIVRPKKQSKSFPKPASN